MIDKFSYDDICQNPYPMYDELRAVGHPSYFATTDNTFNNIDGIWLVSDYAQALEVFKNTSEISKNSLSRKKNGKINLFDYSVLNMDNADHERLHKILQKLFSSISLKNIRSTIQTSVDELLLKLSTRPQFDFVKEFSDILPLQVICELIGFDSAHITYIRQRSLIISDGFDSFLIDENKISAQQTAFYEVLSIVEREIQKKREQPEDDFISGLLLQEATGEISEHEMKAMVLFLLFAGHESTVYALSSAIFLLLSHPQQLQIFQTGTKKSKQSTIEEILRFESATQRTSFRVTTCALNLGGITIPEGSQIGVIINAVNRDPKVFNHPNEFLVDRKPNPHLAFGLGTYNCTGKHLVRMELDVLLTEFWRYLPSAYLAGQPQWRRNTFFRGLDTLIINNDLA